MSEWIDIKDRFPERGFFTLLCGALVFTKTLKEYNEFRKTIKSEAAKDFAERLKPMMFSYYDCLDASAKGRPYKGDTLMDYEVVDMIEDCIDNLVKEMTDNTITKIEHNSLCETETYKKGES